MSSVFLHINSMYFEITPAAFLLNVGTASDGSQVCIIGLTASSDNTWILGDVFLKNYLSVFDDTNNQISFAPHKYTTATITAGVRPTNYFSYSSSSSGIEYYLQQAAYAVIMLVIVYVGKVYGVSCVTSIINNL